MIKNSLKQDNYCACQIHLANDAESHRDEVGYKPKPCLGKHGPECPCDKILLERKSKKERLAVHNEKK